MAIVLYEYTRSDAIRDGVLIDVSDAAVRLGVLMPVALSKNVWEKYVAIPEYLADMEERITEEYRLLDMLTMFRLAASKDPKNDELLFETLVKTQPGPSQCVELKAVVSPSDTHIPVITITEPDEELKTRRKNDGRA